LPFIGFIPELAAHVLFLSLDPVMPASMRTQKTALFSSFPQDRGLGFGKRK